jgi:hypothetical protein
MSEDVEPIERYLRGVAVPQCVSEAHRQQLRRRVLGEIGTRRVCLRNRGWKIAAAAVLVICLSGVVGTLLEMVCRPTGQGVDGVHRSAGIGRETVRTLSSADANGAPPTAQDSPEIGLLYQQGNTELVQVIASEANGQLDGRTLVQKHVWPDGRTTPLGEGDPNGRGRTPPVRLTSAVWTEISQLRQTGKGENLGTQEKRVKGRAFVFTRERYTLRNGTKVVLSVGEPKAVQPAAPSAAVGSGKERK